MWINILIVGEQVIILFVLIGVGIICNKKKILEKHSVKGFVNFVLYIATPCVIISSFERDYDPVLLKGLIITFIAAWISFALNILLANILIHDKEKRKERVYKFAAIFSNCGYMSLPLQYAVLGDIGVFYGAAFVAVFNIVMWSYGIWLMSGDKKYISPVKILTSPGITATVIGVFVFVFSIEFPAVVHEPIKYLSYLNTPIPMVIIGYHIADTKLILKGKNQILTVIFRLLIAPLLLLTGFKLCKITGALAVASIIAIAAPPAATTTMLADKFDQDTEAASVLISVGTILSIISMPAVVALVL